MCFDEFDSLVSFNQKRNYVDISQFFVQSKQKESNSSQNKFICAEIIKE